MRAGANGRGRRTLLESVSSRRARRGKDLRRSWLFFEIVRHGAGSVESTGKPIRAQALSKAVRDERIPELSGLDECCFVVVGGGSLGGPIAVELAKGGAGEITLSTPTATT